MNIQFSSNIPNYGELIIAVVSLLIVRNLFFYKDQKSDAQWLSSTGPNFISGKQHRHDAGLKGTYSPAKRNSPLDEW